MPLAWVPYAGLAEAERRLGRIPDGLELDFYRAEGDDLPGTADQVAFYVLPYMKGTAVLDQVGQMPRLEVVQTLTAGYEDVLPLLPDRVTLCNAAGLHDASAELRPATISRHALVRAPRRACVRMRVTTPTYGTCPADSVCGARFSGGS